MTATFLRTTRFLEADRRKRWRAEWSAVVLLVAWLIWLFAARITVYNVADKARLEVENQAHTIASAVDGRVIETRLAIGRSVSIGEPLVVLDSASERLAIEEKQVRRDSLKARIEAIDAEIDAENAAAVAQKNARAVAVLEAQAQVDEGELRAELAEQLSATSAKLRERNTVTVEEFLTKKSDAEAKRAAVQTLRLAKGRMEQDREATESERKIRLAKLHRETTELKGDMRAEEAAISAGTHEIERRTVRASISGTIGDVTELQVGSVVKAAAKLGSIVPPGEPRAVAMFPVMAAGRLHPGQSGRLRLPAFPWTQYGVIPAVVASVGNEPTDGFIRVELTIDPRTDSAIPREHGLPCSAEVEIERVSPAVLILRAAGQLLAKKTPN